MNEWSFIFGNGGNECWAELNEFQESEEWAEDPNVEFKMAEFKMAAIIKLGENEWVWVRLN